MKWKNDISSGFRAQALTIDLIICISERGKQRYEEEEKMAGYRIIGTDDYCTGCRLLRQKQQ
ncbi:hypothetical protein J41TS12_45370 [Paenibacillus antibioticophila]|uniref:Uncharacterized protein n=1 Tax=Paenibacillus antibioticophila TaxID=1274374 RepID=A0A919XWC2_9BACL|nr:hypothetical protein J41TS12_45370 [Paenibacillus antibioticophila]